MNYIKFIAVMLCLFGACSPPLQTAGGVTDTGNARVTATLFHSDGSLARNATVILRPSDFLAEKSGSLGKRLVSIKDTVTDETGSFQMDSVDTGAYCIEVNDRTSEAVLLKVDIRAGLIDTVLSADTLRPYSTIQGSASVPKSAVGKAAAEVYGLQRFALLDSAGRFAFTNLPGGTLRVHIVSSDSQFSARETDTVSALSGTTAEIPFIFWHFTKRLYLNTTSTGASVAGNVMDFPVLVRLTAADFSFNEALAGGADIRFTKSDLTPLPYEIERWDASLGSAEIWVKTDTVYGNNGSQYIVMFWGASAGFAAVSSSNGHTVFDTGRGFQAVWHLGQATKAAALDATANRYDGTPSDTAPTAVGGAIGVAQQFDGAAACIEMMGSAAGKLDFPQNGQYTVSAWVYVDPVDTNQRFILGKGHEQYLLQQRIINNDTNPASWEFSEYQGTAGWQISRAMPVGQTWKYIVGVRDGTSQYLYVDGILADSSITVYVPAGLVIPRYTTNNFFIGKTPPFPAEHPNYFKGRIDEARAQNTACDPDWIRLCFMNQKTPDALVEFR
jgi:hypothetical protein